MGKYISAETIAFPAEGNILCFFNTGGHDLRVCFEGMLKSCGGQQYFSYGHKEGYQEECLGEWCFLTLV